jgi:hypothetical protein
MVRQRVRRQQSTLTQGFEIEWLAKGKCPWKKDTQINHLCFTKGRYNGTNIRVKIYLNRGRQEPEIYNANIQGVSNMMS